MTKTPPSSDLPTPPWQRVKAWHACDELYKTVTRLSRSWPLEEQDIFGSDLRNSVFRAMGCIMLSVSPRATKARAFKWLDEACGKLGRADALLMMAHEIKLIRPARYQEARKLLNRAARLTSALRARVEPAGLKRNLLREHGKPRPAA